MKTYGMIMLVLLGFGLSVFASPVEDFPRDTVVEGMVSPAADNSLAIMVDNRKVLLNNNTLIRSPSGTLKPTELRTGMMVRVEGTSVRGGLLARIINVVER